MAGMSSSIMSDLLMRNSKRSLVHTVKLKNNHELNSSSSLSSGNITKCYRRECIDCSQLRRRKGKRRKRIKDRRRV
jgi:hypothetical protein